MNKTIALIRGDGIGPEVAMASAVKGYICSPEEL